ncbi:MAG: hypothetical protein KGK01_09635 [Bradyrhizobium sp.]|uniref:hypothetical protein n=1 Tax=Bradyrhizobium sp. TaxID=376 RepID=UPI001C28D177|nr:hypothetical protein [Bradyrhizobium sp.]MBU6464449.1 hypothetical protein [Pseudomonadota bacterium]MDE2069291.1 hypothetical protein [Bradyrhizobium sp.]MDE2242681.1 hypothetical protein [Bradyrhizobium sp.]
MNGLSRIIRKPPASKFRGNGASGTNANKGDGCKRSSSSSNVVVKAEISRFLHSEKAEVALHPGAGKAYGWEMFVRKSFRTDRELQPRENRPPTPLPWHGPRVGSTTARPELQHGSSSSIELSRLFQASTELSMAKNQDWDWPPDGRSLNGDPALPHRTRWKSPLASKLIVGLFAVGMIAFSVLLIKALFWPPT